MKVILLKKVAGLGEIDEIKEVAEGYAKNFLFPNHLAAQANAAVVAARNTRQKKKAELSTSSLKEQQSLAARLDGIEVEIKEKANDSGVLYAAVTPLKIAGALEKMGHEVKSSQVMTKPLKQVGESTVMLRFGHGIEIEITVIIQAL